MVHSRDQEVRAGFEKTRANRGKQFFDRADGANFEGARKHGPLRERKISDGRRGGAKIVHASIANFADHDVLGIVGGGLVTDAMANRIFAAEEFAREGMAEYRDPR